MGRPRVDHIRLDKKDRVDGKEFFKFGRDGCKAKKGSNVVNTTTRKVNVGEGKLVILGDDERPLKPTSVSSSGDDISVKMNDVAPAGNGVDVAISLTSVLEVNERFSNSVYGGDVEDARGVGDFNTISEKEVNNMEEHGLKPNCVDVVNKDKLMIVESGSPPSTSMDLHDSNSASDFKEYDNENAQFMASSY
ncbi:hypothetical protein Tco_0148898 [Tanacetum coccineum]